MAGRSAGPTFTPLNPPPNFFTGARPFVAVLSHSSLLLCALLAVAGLIFLITRWRVPAFIALLLASLAVGACAGLNAGQITKAFQDGVGSVLGSIALIVGLGTVLGKLLAESGGAQQIARRLLALLGPRHLSWTMLLLGFVVGIPVFFGVGLVLLAPILYAVREKSDLPFLRLAIPLLAGLSAAHALVPPHPGPMTAIEMLKADAGKTVAYSLVIGAGAMIVSGPLLCRVCGPLWDRIEPAGALGRQNSSRPADGVRQNLASTILANARSPSCCPCCSCWWPRWPIPHSLPPINLSEKSPMRWARR